jgi:exoribonuclease-2
MTGGEETFGPGNLVIYKTSPARVVSVGAKIEIILADGSEVKVRAKDIIFLHPGGPGPLPLEAPEDPPEDIQAAREIFQGQTTTLAAFAEILYGAFTPAAALGTYRLLLDGLYCRGTPGELYVLTLEEYEKQAALREAKKRGAEDRSALLERIRQGKPEDADRGRLRELEEFALGKSAAGRMAKDLGVASAPEAAHSLLLKLGVWDFTVNPHPSRLGFSGDPRYPALGQPPLEEPRLDLTGLAAFAIDDEDSEDPDDAVSFDNGSLIVHVADPASLIRPDSPADIAARDLGATLYLPEKKIPLFTPRALDLFGLGLQEVSPALSFFIRLGEDGEPRDLEIRPTKIRVTRLSYAQAQEELERQDAGENSRAAQLKKIFELTSRYHARRTRNGALDIGLPEVKIRAADGKVSIRPLPQTDSRTMVTDAMLMAGEAAAGFARANGIPLPYATQEAPETPREKPETLAEMYECRKTLRPSAIRSFPSPHAGLGLQAYCRTTSPLRRYLDLVVHQQLRAFILGTPLLSPDEITQRIGATEAVSGKIQKAERLSNLHWTLVYLLQNPGWQGRAVVVEKGRLCTVLFPDLGLETKVNLGSGVPLNGEVALRPAGIDLARLSLNVQPV